MKWFAFWVLIITLIILGSASYFSWHHIVEWSRFQVDHHCIVISKQGGRPKTIINYGNLKNPIYMVYIPERIAYKCDDGKVYWR